MQNTDTHTGLNNPFNGLKLLATALLMLFFLLGGGARPVFAQSNPTFDQRVILVSVDGLRSDVISTWGPDQLPGFFRLMNESAYTLNARPDPDHTITLPNHTSMVTARMVLGPNGHRWTDNVDPSPEVTIHSQNGSYVPGVFDVVHDAGGKTGFYTSKTKFSLFDFSYNAQNGASDLVGADNGRDKIDTYFYHWGTDQLVSEFKKKRGANALDFAFIHFGNPDAAGHSYGWSDSPTSVYADAVRKVDGHLVDLLNFVTSDPAYAGKTTIIVTADHGGSGQNHITNMDSKVYLVPFWVWDGTRSASEDLYELNPTSRFDPGASYVSAHEASLRPPVRNADAANLGLGLMGLPAIPGSGINPAQDLRVRRAGSGTTAPPQTYTVSFQQGALPTPSYQGATDTHITSDLKTVAHGAEAVLAVDGAPKYAALLRWDLSSIPRDAVVTSATLELDVINPTTDVYEVYALKRDWDEASATWFLTNAGVEDAAGSTTTGNSSNSAGSSSSESTNWEGAGAVGASDRGSVVLGTATRSDQGKLELSMNTQGLVTINSWTTQVSPNFGFIIQDYENAYDGLSFASKEAINPASRPKLTLTYSWSDPNTEPVNLAPQAVADITVVGAGTFDITASSFHSSDPDGLISTIEWDMGDGISLSGETIAHTYPSAGTYIVKLTVWDNAGASSSVETEVVIESNITVPFTVLFQDLVSPTSAYAGTSDTKIMASSPTGVFGHESSLEMDGAPKYHSLLRWDLSSIPTEASIHAAEFSYNVTNISTDPYGLYAVRIPWSEAESTWKSASTLLPWEVAGAVGATDSDQVLLGLLSGQTLGPQRITLTAAGVARVQSWVTNPSSNYGFIIRPVGEAYDGLDLSSRESSRPEERPALSVTYTTKSFEPINVLPSAHFTVTPETGYESVEIHVDATGSRDEDGSIVTYSWDFGDGTRATGQHTNGQQANHQYVQAGRYTIQLTVTDNRGGVDVIHRVVDVLDASVNVVSFQDGAFPSTGYRGTSDTYLSSEFPSQQAGLFDSVEMDGWPRSSALIRWDVSHIPSGATIVAAHITLDVVNWSWDAYEIYGMLRPWSESAATWTHTGLGEPWTGVGASSSDRDHMVLGRANTYETGSLTIPLNEQGIAWVQRWINSPQENFGVVFQDFSAAWDGLDFASRESGNVASRPRLTVEYTQGISPAPQSRVSSDKGSMVSIVPVEGPSIPTSPPPSGSYSDIIAALRPGSSRVFGTSSAVMDKQEYRIDLDKNSTAFVALPSADSLQLDRNSFALDQTVRVNGQDISFFARTLQRGKNAVNVPAGAELFLIAENQSASSVGLDPAVTLPAMHDLTVAAYPNPFSGLFSVDIGGAFSHGMGGANMDMFDIEMVDMLGRVVLRFSSVSSHTQIDAGHLPAGVYLVRVRDSASRSQSVLLTKGY